MVALGVAPGSVADAVAAGEDAAVEFGGGETGEGGDPDGEEAADEEAAAAAGAVGDAAVTVVEEADVDGGEGVDTCESTKWKSNALTEAVSGNMPGHDEAKMHLNPRRRPLVIARAQ